MEFGYTTSGILFFIVSIFTLFCVSWYFFQEAPYFYQNEHYNRIPKKIWTYQDSETPTHLQEECYRSWRMYHPDYEIYILTPKTYQGYIQIPERQSIALWRDRERWEEILTLYTLSEHGGLWLDSHTKLHGSVNQWLFPKFGECSAFYWKTYTISNTEPFIDRRCIAANRDSLFIRRWKEEVERLIQYPSIDKYLRSIYTSTPLTQFTHPEEWVLSFSLQHELLKRPYPMESILLQPVEDGPMKHYEEGRGDKKKAINIGLLSKRSIVFLEE